MAVRNATGGYHIDTALGVESTNDYVIADRVLGRDEEANARLIASAPDLLEAMGKLINFYADYRTVADGYEIRPADEQTNEHIASAMLLYAKATGAA